MHERSVLDNGVRVITDKMAHTRSVCLSIFVGAGSRYEVAERAGISHFVEHLCFKGTQRRATAKEISETIEGVGGVLNGGTDKELTVYWAKVARPHFSLALDLLVDMLRYSKFDPDEVEKERKVIIEELNASLDSPHERVDMLIDEVLWPDQALGRDVAGSRETVLALTRPLLLGYMGQQYRPSNAVVSVAGDITHDEVVDSLARVLVDWSDGQVGPWYPAVERPGCPQLRLERKKTEQAHLCLGLKGLPSLHPDRFVLDLLNVILGEGMSCRLFQELRERRGLAYDVHSYASHFRDSGLVIIYAGVEPKRAEDTIQVILDQLWRLKDQEVPNEEITKARELSKGRLLLRMEDTRSVAGWAGGQELLTGRIHTVDEVLSIVDAITPGDLLRVARELFIPGRLSLAVVGPFRQERGFKRLLQL